VRTTAQTSPLVEPMKDLVEMYETLNGAFPHSDYVTLKPTEVCYWVNRSMHPEYDFLGTLEKLKPMIEKLKSLPSKGEKITRENDPAEGIVFACYPNFHDDTQENYVELVFNRNTMHFCYISRNKNAVLGHEANPAIVEEMEKLFGEYVSRKDVGSVESFTMDLPINTNWSRSITPNASVNMPKEPFTSSRTARRQTGRESSNKSRAMHWSTTCKWHGTTCIAMVNRWRY